MEDNKVKFFEMLSSITEVAKVQNNKITKEEVVQLFGDLELSKEQYEHVYAYLIANGVELDEITEEISLHVKSYQKNTSVEEVEEVEHESKEVPTEFEEDEESYSTIEAQEGNIYGKNQEQIRPSSLQEETDSIYLKMYLEDLGAIESFADGEELLLLQKVKQNDNLAVSRLVEGYLLHVIEIAKQYTYSGLLVEDIIGEGNIGLMAGVGSLSAISSLEEMREHIELSIRTGILNMLDEVVDLDALQKRVIERANYLNSASNELAEDMGRDPSLAELSAYTKISEEDIKDIIYISGDNIKVKIAHEHK